MTDKIPTKFVESVNGYIEGDRTSLSPDRFQRYREAGKVQRVTKPSEPTDRDEVEGKVIARKVREALASDDYIEMKQTLAQVSDIPATGDKEAIRGKLESLLE